MINKFRLSFAQKPLSLQHKTQQFSPYEKKIPRKNSQHHKDLLIPLQKLSHKNFDSKPLRSQAKSTQNNLQLSQKDKIPQISINTIKNSLLLRQNRQSLEFRKIISNKKSITNRIYTEKARNNQQWFQPQSQSKNKSKKSINKIRLKQNHILSKETSPNSRKQTSNQKNIIFDNLQQKKLLKINNKNPIKQQKNLTAFQKQQMIKYEIHYVGNRRIHSKTDFTDNEGDSKIVIGDSIAYRYQIIKLLGRGSFGQVYKAFDHKKKQLIALKIIKSQLKFLKQAKVEVQILECALLNDPKLKCNIVRMKGSFVFRGHSCITFQILHKNLYQFLKQNNFCGFSLDLIRRFAIQILQCLHFFSKHRIVHCDLKPQNILLKQENKSGIRVIDVGSGCFESQQIYTYIQSRFYRAPEIILGIKYTCAIDMWSFGCILVQLFTGFPIFPGESQNQQMLMFMQTLGYPPYSMLQIAQRKKKFFTDNFQCKIPQQKGKQRITNSLKLKDILGNTDKDFLNLISKCLQWDPSKRVTPREALLHEWIIEGLPSTIREKHIQQVNENQNK